MASIDSRSVTFRRIAFGVVDWVGWMLSVTLFVSVLAFLAAFIFRNPNAWIAAEQDAHAAVEQENQTICAKFGIDAGTSRYDECAAELKKVRELDEKRRAEADQGII